MSEFAGQFQTMRGMLNEDIQRIGPKKFILGAHAVAFSGERLRPGRYMFEMTYNGRIEERYTASVSFTEHECEILNRLHAQAQGGAS